MSKFNTFLLSSSSTISLWVLFLTTHVVLAIMLGYTFPILNNTAGGKVFDLRTFGYSLEEAQTILGNLDQQAIDLYIFPQLLVLDVLYPILLALFLSSLLFRLTRSIKFRSRLLPLLLLLPFLAMVFDYLENACILLMITETLEPSAWGVSLSSFFTLSKSILTSVAWISILVCGIQWIRTKYNPYR